MTAALSQRSDSTKMTKDESLHIYSTTDITSYPQYSFDNGNENEQVTDPTSTSTYHATYPGSLANQNWSVIIT